MKEDSNQNTKSGGGHRAPPLHVLSLVVLGAASACIYFWARDLHRFTQWVAAYLSLYIAQLAIYAVACWLVFRFGRPDSSRRAAVIGVVLVFAALFRAELVSQRPYLSSDVYRYVWDGRVEAARVNPYAYTPNAEELRPLRDENIFPLINPGDRDWLSPYPPAAQAFFLGVYKVSPTVTAFKTAMSLCDLLAAVLVMIALARAGLDPARAIVFAWHPLLIVEGAHSGHVESLFILFLAAALAGWSYRKPALTGGSLALAALVKFYPLLLLPAFLAASPERKTEGESVLMRARRTLFNRRSLMVIGAVGITVIVAYLPYAGAGSKVFAFAQEYLQEEGFLQSGARYFPLLLLRKIVPLPTGLFAAMAALVMAATAFWSLIQPKRDVVGVARCALAMIGAYLLITTPRYAWYYVWLLPCLCFAPRVPWLYLASAAALLYLVWYTPLVYPNIPLWLGAAIYVPAAAGLILELRRRREDNQVC